MPIKINSQKRSLVTALAFKDRNMARGSRKKTQKTILPSHNGAASTFAIHSPEAMTSIRQMAFVRNFKFSLSSSFIRRPCGA